MSVRHASRQHLGLLGEPAKRRRAPAVSIHPQFWELPSERVTLHAGHNLRWQQLVPNPHPR